MGKRHYFCKAKRKSARENTDNAISFNLATLWEMTFTTAYTLSSCVADKHMISVLPLSNTAARIANKS